MLSNVVLSLLSSAVLILEGAESIIGGWPPELHEVGYFVSLQHDGEHFCGAGIIGERHLLTAAHCVVDEDDEIEDRELWAVAGTDDLREDDAVVVQVEKIYVPEEYNATAWEESVPLGDIAVLKLREGLNLRHDPHLRKLRLPRQNKRYPSGYKSYEGDDAVVSGFGWDKVTVKTRRNKTEYEVGSSEDRLLSANAKVIGTAECQEHYVGRIGPSELCARIDEYEDDRPEGVCRGDSGGPLVYKGNTVIGVVSGISMGCNENNEPGIYTRVSSYINFVRMALKDKTENMRTLELL